MTASSAGGNAAFATRIMGVFGTRVIAFGFSVTASLLVSRLLGTAGQGSYSTVVTFVALLFTFGQLGLPSALTFFAGRGRSLASLMRAATIVAVSVSAVLLVGSVLLVPNLQGSILSSATIPEALLGLVALPILLTSALGGSLLYGRQATRNYNLIQLGQAAASLIGVVALVGFAGLGVQGALLAYLGANGAGAAGVLWEVRRLARVTVEPTAIPASLRELGAYGLRLYPASVTSYFNYRADVLLLNAFHSGATDIGYYGRAVNFAELLFYVPDSISTIFYPTVAGSTREAADRLAMSVTRLTVLMTAMGALAMLPVAFVVIELIIPAFLPAMIPLALLLPGILSLSVSKVLAGYVSGLGRPIAATVAASVAMVANVLLNLSLIPGLGIGGAALSSLASYSLHAAIMVAFAVRISGQPARLFLVPGRVEIERLRDVARLAWGHLRPRITRGR